MGCRLRFLKLNRIEFDWGKKSWIEREKAWWLWKEKELAWLARNRIALRSRGRCDVLCDVIVWGFSTVSSMSLKKCITEISYKMSQLKSFDPIPLAKRPCTFVNNTMFHNHPTFPCTKLCFSDVWETLHEEYGSPVHGWIWEEHNIEKYGEKSFAIERKRAEYQRRINLILKELVKKVLSDS